jgi:tetratricopeptide (TPR) repeat protein
VTTPTDDASGQEKSRGGQEPVDQPESAHPKTDEAQPAGQHAAEVLDSSGPPQPDAAVDDDLPEWEPLTPELVEDEAIRADFMLRWAVVLLAFLLGCTEIAESATLVHVKTGQYVAGHGFWPPANDVFSYTAADRPWINLSWGFDLVLAGVFAVLGAVGLSFFKALLAAATFGFVMHTSRPGVSTWWGAVCGALALLVCYPQFTALPESITLLGLAVTLWILHTAEADGQSRLRWALVPIFLLWSNFDNRMFLGLALLVLYALGETLAARWGRPIHTGRSGRRQPLENSETPGTLWLVAAACFAAALLNPWGWHSLTAPVRLYGLEYPTWQLYHGTNPSTADLQFFPMASATYWQNISHHTIAGLLLGAATVVTFLLNFRQLKPAHLLVFLGFAGFALAGSHELAAAALVCCVLANLNAQAWYQANFRQTYSVETSELLFSRGGRAATVLAFFGLAFLAVSGRLEGPDGRRAGYGFHFALQSNIDGLREQLVDAYDPRPFNFVLEQGDLLIWLDRQAFVDNRVALYAGGQPSLIELHRTTRSALRRPPAGTEGSARTAAAQVATGSSGAEADDSHVWKETFDRFEVTHVLPRLSGQNPDYVTCFDLLRSPDWHLAGFGPVTALFYRTDTGDAQLKKYLEQHRYNFMRRAYKEEAEPPGPRPDWPRPRSFYQKYLSLPEHRTPLPVQEARHYAFLFSRGSMPFSLGSALAHLAIRKANEGLVTHPDNALAFQILGDAYSYLGMVESQVSQLEGSNHPNWLRFYQTLHAYNQALIIEPDEPILHLKLFQTYERVQKWELAQRSLRHYDRLTMSREDLGSDELELRRQLSQLQRQLSEMVKPVVQQIDAQLSGTPDRYQLAQTAYQNGCGLKALRVLEDDPETMRVNPLAQRLYAILLMEAGRAEDAADTMGRLEGVAQQIGMPGWRSPAALASLAFADYERAIDLWTEEAQSQESAQLEALLHTLPFIQPPSLLMKHTRDAWPVQQVASVFSALYDAPAQAAALHYNAASIYLEQGRVKDAADAFHKVLELEEASPLRPLVRHYLFELTDEVIEPEPPSDWIPITPALFADEPE